MRLYEKAKRLGTWDPSAIDLARDAADWTQMTEDERLAIEQISALFLVGEEAVTIDLLPLVLGIAREGRLEEELFLTTFLFEEGKHTQFFRRFLDEVAGSPPELDRWITPSYRTSRHPRPASTSTSSGRSRSSPNANNSPSTCITSWA